MQRVSTSNLVPGMVTAEDVYTYTNKLLIKVGSELTDNLITKLEFYSIISVRITDESIAAVSVPDKKEADNPSYSEKIRNSQEFIDFKLKFEGDILKFRQVMDGVVQKKLRLDLDALFKFVEGFLSVDNGYLSVFDMLHNLREYDDSTYTHCLNVSLMCNVFSRWLNMHEDEQRTATLCGLLHDIGKIAVPQELILKNGSLTDNEYSIVKKHTIEGYNILKRCGVSSEIANAALMHHERSDGSGYPLGISNDKIDEFAKMVAVIDVYDAMTSARVYRGPMCPFKVIAIFESEGFQKYDVRYVSTFLENIVNTHLLQRVRLSDGRVGEIVFINKNKLSRPTVKCGETFIDLTVNKDLIIEEIL